MPSVKGQGHFRYVPVFLLLFSLCAKSTEVCQLPKLETPPTQEPSQIGSEFQKLSAVKNGGSSPDITIRRLVPEGDYKQAKIQFKEAWPEKIYGQGTSRAFMKAADFVNHEADGIPIGPDLLRRIHYISTEDHYFLGYELRRLSKLLENKQITPDEFSRLKNLIHSGKQASERDHATLRGVFRDSDFDQARVKFDLKAPKKEAFAQMRQNQYIEFPPDGVEVLPSGRARGKFLWPASEEVDGLVNDAFKKFDVAMRTATQDREIIRAAISLQKDLMSIHPFSDGNGRSIRLLVDSIYHRSGLPPPLHPIVDELERSVDDMVETTIQQMQNYNRALAESGGT